MSGEDCLNVRRAVLVEQTDALITQTDATRATLNALGCEDITTLTC
jgi:cytidine deaminase